MRAPLPIDDALPELIAAVRDPGVAVLVAPPGAGKTTRVPGALLDAGLAGDGKVIMLQPRRVAARACARRIAAERGGVVGEEVGYQVRFERKVSARTRIEIITEGLLTRRLQADPFLEGVGVLILDEFHERSLNADLGLALAAEVRRSARPDLRIVVMSATLDPGPVAEFLGASASGQRCPIVQAEGRTFPVEIEYSPSPEQAPLAERASEAISKAISQLESTSPGALGHVLAFLPGVGEIERAQQQLRARQLPEGAEVLPLHGRLSPAAQDRALSPGARRKIILATNIAETSLTVDGVVAVVDTGEARVPRFDPSAGLERLERVPISQASADQRAGRAGRTRAGTCHRLWTHAQHLRRPEADRPEIARADLAATLLEIYTWGTTPEAFEWFQAPDPRAIEQARALLTRLGALDAHGLTPLGRTLASLPTHPRLGRAIIEGRRLGRLEEVATVAALAGERDIFAEAPPAHVADSDLDLRLEALAAAAPVGRRVDGREARRWGLAHGPTERVAQTRDQLIRIAQRQGEGPDTPTQGKRPLIEALMAGFPDRVGQRRAPRGERFKLANGSGARLSPRSAVKEDMLILAVGLEGGRTAEHLVTSAWGLDPSWLPTESEIHTRFDPAREAVIQSRVVRYMALTLEERPAGEDADRAAVAATLAVAAAADPSRAFKLDDKARGYLARLRCAAAWAPGQGLPDLVSLSAPSEKPDLFIEGICLGRRSFADLQRVDMVKAIQDHIGYAGVQAVDRLAPDRVKLPGGATARVTYGEPESPPVFSARIQHLFGLLETPRVGGGRVPVLLHLLAPNMRPVQITSDLASFWDNTYAQVRKDLRGRYPKHPWPEDPRTATPVGPRHRRR